MPPSDSSYPGYNLHKEAPMQQLGRKVLERVRPRVALVFVIFAAVLGPGWLAPAGAAGPVVSSTIIPLTGTVGNIRLSGVVHVVTKVLLQEPPPFSTGFLTVHAYLTPSDVSAVDRQGHDYLAHGAGTPTFADIPLVDMNIPQEFIVTGFA